MILKAKKFSLFKDWNIDMILFSRDLSSNYSLVKLEKIIVPRKEKKKPNEIPNERFIVSKIRFSDGKVFFEDRVIKNDMYKSCLGDLLVSNINFEKGAFAINVWGDAYASTDYTSYIIDTKQIVPEFLFLVLRSKLFMEYVASVKPKGMKTRARYDFIKNFDIPLPLISEQELIIEKYHSILEAAEENEHNGDVLGANLLQDIQSEVSNYKGKNKQKATDSSILQTVPFSSVNRWEVGYTLKEGRLEEINNSFTCPSFAISEIALESLFGLSVKASETQEDGMIPMLRMSNIVNGEIDYEELKYLPYECAVTSKEKDKWLLREEDFLVVRTNGSKDLVGKAATFHGDDIYTYASYLIRYRFDASVVLSEYVNILFQTPIVRDQIAVMRRQGGGQYNLNSDEIGAIRIPVPSILEQQAIIDRYNATKDGARKYYEKSNSLTIQAETDFQNKVFQ